MSRFVVMDEAEQSCKPAQPWSTATNHPGGKAGDAREIPCATCVRSLTSDSPSHYQPCYNHLGRKAKKCFQCSSRKKLCYELPPDAVAFGVEFQQATIRRFEGQTVDDWEILGEATMQAINEASCRPSKRTRRARLAPTAGIEDLIEVETSGCGQPQVGLEEQQSFTQQPFQPTAQDLVSRQDLQDLRTQILHDVRQVLVERHQSGRQDESIEKVPAPPAAEPLAEQSSLHGTVRDIMEAAQRSREGVSTIVIHFH